MNSESVHCRRWKQVLLWSRVYRRTEVRCIAQSSSIRTAQSPASTLVFCFLSVWAAALTADSRVYMISVHLLKLRWQQTGNTRGESHFSVLPLTLVPRNRVVSARGENTPLWNETSLVTVTSSYIVTSCCYVTRGDTCWSQTSASVCVCVCFRF